MCLDIIVFKKNMKSNVLFHWWIIEEKTIPYHINGGFNGNIIYRFWVFSTPCLITRRVYVSNSPIPMNSHGFTPPHGFFFIGTCCGRSSRPSWTSSWTERRRSGSMCPVPWLWWFRGLGSFYINVGMIYGDRLIWYDLIRYYMIYIYGCSIHIDRSYV